MMRVCVPEVGDPAYYEGFVFGHFGHVTAIHEDGTITVTTQHLLIATSEHQWDEHGGSDRSGIWYIPQAKNDGGTVTVTRQAPIITTGHIGLRT